MEDDDEAELERRAAAQEFFDLTRDLERALEIPPRLLIDLIKDDDWSLVIRTHALLEAAATSLLVDALGSARLAPSVAKMRMWQRLTFLEALELWDPTQIAFARLLSKLRNDLVHDVGQARFRFTTYLASLSETERRRFWRTLAVEGWPTPAVGDPESIVWWRTIEILAHSAFELEKRAAARQSDELAAGRLGELERLLRRMNARLSEGELNRLQFGSDALEYLQRYWKERRARQSDRDRPG